MRNTIIITSVLFIAVVVASIFYFADLKQGDQSKRKAFARIPEDAVFVVCFQNDDVVDLTGTQIDQCGQWYADHLRTGSGYHD